MGFTFQIALIKQSLSDISTVMRDNINYWALNLNCSPFVTLNFCVHIKTFVCAALQTNKCTHADKQMHTCARINAHMHTNKCVHADKATHTEYNR